MSTEELDRHATPARAVVGELVAGTPGQMQVSPGA